VTYSNTLCRQCGTDIGEVTNRKPFGGLVGLAVAGIVLYFLFYSCSSSSDSSSTRPSITSPAYRGAGNASAADAAQIKQLVQTWTDAFNNRDLATMSSLLCRGVRLPANPFNPRDIRGAISGEVTNINVSGNRATSNIIASFYPGGTGHEALESNYAKENGSWRICKAIIY
jgi:hypothetical protein